MARAEDVLSPAEVSEVESILRSNDFTSASLLDYGDGAQLFFGVSRDEYARVDVDAVAWQLTLALPGRKAQITDYAEGPAPRVRIY